MIKPYYERAGVSVFVGHVLDVLRQMPAESVHTCVTSPPYWALRSYLPADHPDKALEIGSEPTPEAYVAKMVEVFREVRRVLRGDGTCWVNWGDCYQSGSRGSYERERVGVSKNKGQGASDFSNAPNRLPQDGLKDKDLVGIPWRAALALQADGWTLRSEITWCKRSCMPESVTDRPTNATEKIFLLTKSPRYFYDAEAVKEPNSSPEQLEHNLRYAKVYEASDNNAVFKQPNNTNHLGIHSRPGSAGRNMRNYWLLGPEPSSVSHFATFVSEIPKRAILAGTSEAGCCSQCGKPWIRNTEKIRTFESGSGKSGNLPNGKNGTHLQGGGETLDIRRGPVVHTTTTGWQPTCKCAVSAVPCVVLDPFAGSGTALQVAKHLGRHAVGIELYEKYAQIIVARLPQDVLPLVHGG